MKSIPLFLHQALSLRLEQESKELEAGLQQAYTCMENGEAPDNQAEAEWERMLQDEKRKKQALIDKMRVSSPPFNNIICGHHNNH